MIRQAEIKDASRIVEIHIFGWRCAYRGIISDDYLFTTLSVAQRIKPFEKVLEEHKKEIYVYEEEEIIKAFMTIGRCRDDDKKNAFELWALYVEPLMKHQGIGTKMIRYCEDIAVQRGFAENIVWVLKDNDASRKFYEKIGYKPDGKENYLQDIHAIEVRYTRKLKREPAPA